METLNTSSDIQNMCRFCLSSSELSEFENVETEILNVLDDIIECDATSDASFPQKICNQCINNLRAMHAFVENFKQSTAVILDIIESSRLEVKEAGGDDLSNIDDDLYDFDEASQKIIDHDIKENGDLFTNKDGKLSPKNAVASPDRLNENGLTNVNISIEVHGNNENEADLYTDYSSGDDYKTPKPFKRDLNKLAVYLQTCEIELIGCNVCGETFKHMRYLLKHQTENKCKPKECYCSVCSKQFSSTSLMRTHLIDEHQGIGVMYKCPSCDNSFDHLFMVYRHEKTHLDKKAFLCVICHEAFGDGEALKEHVRGHSSENPFQCKFCPETFHDNSLWHEHVNMHLTQDAQEKPNDDITDVSLLQEMSQDEEEISYSCHICDKEMANRYDLQNHLDIHDNGRKHNCDVCPKTFDTSQSLMQHINQHHHGKTDACEKGPRRYGCGFCGKKFTHNYYLAAHLKAHKCDQKLTCSYCNKTFNYKVSLKIHERIHTGEKPHQCGICPERFISWKKLQLHKSSTHETTVR